MAVPHLYRSKCTLPLGKIDNTPILPSLRVYVLLVGGYIARRWIIYQT